MPNPRGVSEWTQQDWHTGDGAMKSKNIAPMATQSLAYRQRRLGLEDRQFVEVSGKQWSGLNRKPELDADAYTDAGVKIFSEGYIWQWEECTGTKFVPMACWK